MADVEVGDYTYRTGRLDTFKKLHVARKLAPMLAAVGVGRTGIAEGSIGFEAFVGPIAEALAKMSDDEVEQIIGTCLNVVQRKLPGDTGWTPIWNKQAKALQFEDIDLPEVLSLTMTVLQDNIGGFLPGNLGASPAPG